MSLKDDLEGKRVVCPHCQTAFVAAAGDGQQADPVADSQATDSAVPGMEFLSSWPANRAGSKATSGRSDTPATAARASTKTAAADTGRSKRKKRLPLELYITGGVVGVLLILVGGFYAMRWAPARAARKARAEKEKVENVQYGMSELERRRAFYHFIGFVDKYGMGERCLKAWKQDVAEFGINNDTIAKILDEGFSHQWPQPDFPVGNASARQKRKDWIRTRREMNDVEPMFKY